MDGNRPSFIQMIRAPFLSSIISPLLIGTILAYSITGDFDIINFIVVFVMGICFHTATNVYNDIYDTLQGTDEININRNEFSGGSGVIVNNPNLLPIMFRIARIALLGALITAILLMLRIQDSLKIILTSLFFLSAFFSKYYTAAPIKLAYRGWGEISVWFAFGPMATLVAAVSQNVGLNNLVFVAMPITGISTLSILLIGQMIDFDADKVAGKWGIAVRFGNKTTGYVYSIVQLLLCANIIILSLKHLNNGWPILFSLIPYAILLPQILNVILLHCSEIELLKKAARLNVFLHLIFSLLFIFTLIGVVVANS